MLPTTKYPTLFCGRHWEPTTVSTSVAELLPEVGSVTPAGAATVAVLLMLPIAVADTAQVAVKVTLAPAGRLTLLAMLPLPDAGQVPPPAPTQVQVQVRGSREGVTHGGAAGVAGSGVAGSDRVSQRSARYGSSYAVGHGDREIGAAGKCVCVSCSVVGGSGSLTPPGAATVAVLLSVPVAAAEIAQLAVYVALAPTGKLTVLLMLPEPLAVQVPPPAPTQVQVQVRDAGKVSATVAPVALLGASALLAVMVYVTEPPGVAVVTPSGHR